MEKSYLIPLIVSKAHIPPAIAIRGVLNKFCRCNFLMFADWRDKKKKECVCTGYLYVVYTVDQPIAHVCIKLQLCRPHRKVTKILCFGI